MKKTYIAILAVAGFISTVNAATVLHDVTFTAPSTNPLHSAYSTNADAAAANMYLGSSYYTNANKGTSYDGIYIANGGGLKFNHSVNVTVNHLYLDSAIEFSNNTTGTANVINWSTSNHKLIIGNQNDAWVDVNAIYTRIDTSSMANGSVYLNEYGQLSSSLASTNEIFVTALLGDVLLNLNSNAYSVETVGANTLVSRTLMVGNYSNWTGTVTLDGFTKAEAGTTWESAEELTSSDANKYYVTGTSNGLVLTYVASVPEPATVSLSLLGLAALMIRRRRA